MRMHLFSRLQITHSRALSPSAHEEFARVTIGKALRDPDPSVFAEPALNCVIHDGPALRPSLSPAGQTVAHEGYLSCVFLLEQRKSRINCMARALALSQDFLRNP